MKLGFGLLGVFGLGVGVGVAAHKLWPEIEKTVVPLGKDLLNKGLESADKIKESLSDQGEKFADVIADLKEKQSEQASESKGNGKEAPLEGNA